MPIHELPKNPVLRRALEQRGQRASSDTHEEAAKRIIGLMDPVLAALSVPERSGVVFEGQSTAEPYTRRILSYPPHLERVSTGVANQDYFVSVADGKLDSGISMPLVFTTSDGWDDISLGSVVNDEGFLSVKNALGVYANREEIAALEGLAEWTAKMAPRQAVYNGNISPSWMERYMLDELHEGYPFYEGLPRRDASPRDGLFEVIRYTGGRAVCRLSGWNRREPVWVDEVTDKLFARQPETIAWRNVTSDPKPSYYLQAKYPDLYKK